LFVIPYFCKNNAKRNPNMKLGTLTQFTLITLPAIAAFQSTMDVWAPFDLAEGVEVTLQHGDTVDTMNMFNESIERAKLGAVLARKPW
jgi:hypothetical protein